MPVRSLHSSILRWPDGDTVRQAARDWALALLARDGNVKRVGYRGSHARGEEGVGSDLDWIIVLAHCELPFERRATLFDSSDLPVPADLVVYTATEFAQVAARGDRFARELAEKTVWFFQPQDAERAEPWNPSDRDR